MRKNQKLFTVEITDTFGGEANYCWVHRYIVRASSERGAVCVVARQYGGNWVGTGDGFRYDQVGAAVCFFLEFCEDETQAIAHGYAPLNYTRNRTHHRLARPLINP